MRGVYILFLVFGATDNMCILSSKIPISSLNPMFDHLLESYFPDDSKKRSNIGYGQSIEIT